MEACDRVASDRGMVFDTPIYNYAATCGGRLDIVTARRLSARMLENGISGGTLLLHILGKSERPVVRRAPACRRTTNRGVAGFISRRQDFSLCSTELFDELPGGNHRRGRAGATRGGGAYGAYRCGPTAAGGGPGHTGNVGAAHTSRPFAFRKVQPSSPSACRAAASRSARHSAWQAAMKTRPRLAVRNLLPLLPRNERQTATETARRADRRSGERESRRRSARARNGRRRTLGQARSTGSIGDRRPARAPAREATTAACSIIVAGGASSPSRQSSPRPSP